MSNPDEDRLLVQLFDPEYQKNNLQTYPVHSIHEILQLDMRVNFIKLVDIVRTKLFFLMPSIVCM